MAGRQPPACGPLVQPELIAVINRVRAALPVLTVLPCADLPAPGALAVLLGARRIAQAGHALAHPSTQKPLSRLVSRARFAKVPFADIARNPRASDGRVHDGYFAVERGRREDPTVLFDGILAAVLCLWIEAEDPAAVRDDLAQLGDGLALAFVIATGHDPVTVALPAPAAAPDDPYAAAARRWLRGHQMFLVLIQAMIQTMTSLTGLAGADRDVALDRMARLFDASAAAMRHTGNFDARIYDRMIRPSMAPPYIVNGFSGLFSSDHRLLVQLLRSEGEGLRAGAFACPHRQQRMVAALGRLYDDHSAVCARFVGFASKSLLAKKDAECSALDQIATFRKSRLRLISRE